jgi:hypothetical protein
MRWTHEEAVQRLADRVGCPKGPAADRERTLEESLLPMVRCALRSGLGHPRLVRWVRKTLPAVPGPHQAGRPVDPDLTGPPLARLLFRTLLREMYQDPARALETVLGA